MNSRTTRRFRELLAALPAQVREQARGSDPGPRGEARYAGWRTVSR